MIPQNLRYTEEHEWICLEAGSNDTALVGITHHAQDSLGDVVYVDLPGVGASFDKMATFGSVESVKAVSDLFMPLACTVLEVNTALADEPELLNTDPYGKGWLIKVKLNNPAELDGLLNADAYAKLTA